MDAWPGGCPTGRGSAVSTPPKAAGRSADPEPRKCRLRTSKRNFAGTEALAYPQTVSVTEGEHLPGGRCGHSVHIADRGYSRERSSFGS